MWEASVLGATVSPSKQKWSIQKKHLLQETNRLIRGREISLRREKKDPNDPPTCHKGRSPENWGGEQREGAQGYGKNEQEVAIMVQGTQGGGNKEDH